MRRRAEERGRRGVGAPARTFLLSAFLPCVIVLSAFGQEADSARVAPDTVGVATESRALPPAARRAGPPMGFVAPLPGIAVADTLPAQRSALSVVGLLEDEPGGFTYDFGTAGWPDGWSPYGLDPRRVGLSLGGLPMDDLLTDRPRYNLLPLPFTEAPRLAAGVLGASLGVLSDVRAYDLGSPLTELRYMSGGNGLQSIDALHVQRRRRTLFGTPGTLQILGSYGGRAADGVYEGSRLQKARQVQVRLRYAQPRWSAELYNLHNRRSVGAQGGVIPQSGNLRTIYFPLLAEVRNPGAVRRTVRNDLAATFRARLVPGLSAPLAATAFWTAQSFGYRRTPDTLDVRLNRYGLRVQQAVEVGGHRLDVRLTGWLDRADGRRVADTLAAPVLGTEASRSRTRWHATLRDSLRVLGAEGALTAGIQGGPEGVAPTAAARFTRPAGAWHLFAEAGLAAQTASWVEAYGFGRLVQPVADAPAGRIVHARAGGRIALGAFGVTVFGFASRTTNPLDLYVADGDTVSVQAAEAPFLRVGGTAVLGWRRRADRGFYATAHATLLRLLDAQASELHTRSATALPDFFGGARAGARYVIFRGDLDFDVYLEGRFWSAMRSRTLHAPTALLAVPGLGDPAFGPSGTFSLVAEAGVREATFFLRYENLLLGTQLQVGTLLVPLYPLPPQQFRFGVYWPILD